MVEITIVTGHWVMSRKGWEFSVDEKRGSRVLYSKMSFVELVAMVYEDFGLDRRLCTVQLSYKLPEGEKCISRDTPPVIVCNGRQYEGFLRHCQTVRLCVEIEPLFSEKPFVRNDLDDKFPTKRDFDFAAELSGSFGVKKYKCDDQYYMKKAAGESPMKSDANEQTQGHRVDDSNVEAQGSEEDDEDENYRFDCIDDSDGASSGDEDYCLYSNACKAEVEPEYEEEEHDVAENQSAELQFREKIQPPRKDFSEIFVSAVDIRVGQKFNSKADLQNRLQILTVLQRFDFDVNRSRPKLYVVKCWVKGCKWRVRASTIGDSPIFHIRVYVKDHTCSVTERSFRARKATPEILGQLYKEFVGSTAAGVLPIHVADALNLRYGIQVDYWKARRTLKCARQLARGTSEDGYQHLPAYLYLIRKANPGTLTRLQVDDIDRFKFVFIAFAASIAGFPFMRKVIVVDGTFLKGPYKGTLLLATTQDGNFNIFPLAFAVVDSENDAAWEWFFRQLCCVIPDDEGLTIISDRHKSIGKAIGNIYPLASRGVCTYHLYKNILVRFRGSETFGLVKKAANAFRVEDFNVIFQQISGMNADLHAYLVRADVGMWTRAHFPGDRYNFTTTNNAESLNHALNRVRDYPIVELLDAIRLMLTRWFAARRKQAIRMTTVLTTGVEKLLETRVARATKLSVQEIDPHQYEVRGGGAINVVNLAQNKCTCRRFDVEKLPCEHAIAAAEKAKVSRITKCHPYYRKDYLFNGYAKSIMPRDLSFPVPEAVLLKNCNPPFVRTQAGRPKMSRAKGPLETSTMRSKQPRKNHACSKCNQTGHNRTTCGV